MDEIEDWRQKAFVLSRTDRLGRLIAKTFDLIQTVVRDGPNAEMLIFEVEMIKAEQENVMKADKNQCDIFRSLFYGLSLSLGLMIESIQERNEGRVDLHQEIMPIDQVNEIAEEDSQMINGDANNTTIALEYPPLDQVFVLGTPKAEETEIQIATLSVDELVKFELSDCDSLEQQNGNDDSMHEADATSFDNEEVAESVGDSLSEEPANSQDIEARRKRLRSSIASTGNKKRGKLVGKDVSTGVQVSISPGAGKFAGTVKFDKSGEFPCSECGRTFANMASFRIHERTHKPERCSECGMRTESRESLQQHYEECHPGKDAETSEKGSRTLTCSLCDKRIRGGPANLRDHERTHTGERPFECSMCFKTFKASGKFHLHMRDDHGEKPFQCDHCPLKFARRAEMQQHKHKDHRGH